MTVPATDPRPATPPSDDVVLETIARLHSDAGELPGRDAVKAAAGIGSTRAARLIAQYAEAQGIELPARGRKQASPASAQPDRAGETGRADVVAQAGGHDDQGKQLQPTASAQSEQAGETGRDTTTAQAGRAGGAGRTESTAQADRAGEAGRVEAAAQASDAGETGRDAATAQAGKAGAAQAGQPGELAQWSGLLRGAVARRLASRPAREAQPEDADAPSGRVTRARFAVARSAPLWLVFIAAFLATWAGGVTLATRVGSVEVLMFPGWSETIAYNPALSLPLCMEVLMAVAIHRARNAADPSHRRLAGWIAVLSLTLAIVVQIEAYQGGPAPFWLQALAHSLPVIALALVALLSGMKPGRRH